MASKGDNDTPKPRTRKPRRRLGTDDYRSMAAFRLAVRRFLAFSETASRTQGLTPQQHQALLAIRAHPGPEPMSIGELADELLIKNHSAVGLVSRLAERGLVVREISEVDRRRVVLTITPDAQLMVETITRQNLGELGRFYDNFAELLGTLKAMDLDGALPADRQAKRPRAAAG